jgi:hypothetical protein
MAQSIYSDGTAAKLTSAGSGDIFVASMMPLVNYVWARRSAAPGMNVRTCIAIDASSNVT